MESAQFYHFAHVFAHADTQYVAFRGVANLADQVEMQGDYSQQVLTDALGGSTHHCISLTWSSIRPIFEVWKNAAATLKSIAATQNYSYCLTSFSEADRAIARTEKN